ncbi:unnamed protein product [Lymnaea stagnalis]|uniref:RanBP2-type domain-containing protein n=1 Tax=Lymnaea stagnalis TaxID=6523 RepID=A0AAV2HJZ9_LYMST
MSVNFVKVSASAAVSELESASPFSSFESESSCTSINYQKLKSEKEKVRKLEEKITGYKTVVQTLPKYESTILEFKRKEDTYKQAIEDLKKQLQDQINTQETSKTSSPQEAQGITEFGAKDSLPSSTANTRSPSFVVIDPPEDAALKQSQQVETRLPNFYNTSTGRISQSSSSPTLICKLPPQPHSSAPNHTGTPWQIEQDQLAAGYSVYLSSESLADPSSLYGSRYTTIVHPSNYYYPPDPIRVVRVNSQSNKPVLKMEQEACVLPLASPALGNSSGQVFRQQETSSGGPIPAAQGTHVPPHQGLGPTGQDLSTTSHTYFTLAPFHGLTTETYGVGARPKEWKPLNIPPTSVQSRNSARPARDAKEERLNTLVQIHDVPPQQGRPSTLLAGLSPSHNLRTNNLNGENNASTEVQQSLVEVGSSSDLMKFSMSGSIMTNPASENVKVPASTGYSENSRDVTFPSDDHFPLASQAESMAALLKTNESPKGMSELLTRFAKEFEKVECQLQEKQAMIQRQQVQIQGYEKGKNEKELLQLKEENQYLREENETLISFIRTQREGLGSAYTLHEPGWVAVGNQMLDSSRNIQADHPIMKKVDALEQINAKLFLANKDWHNKWEVLRQTHQEKLMELEANFSALNQEKEKLLEENSALEKQLKDANMSKEESSQIVLSLQNEKIKLQKFVDSLRNDVDLLTSEKRRLNAELLQLKQSQQKAKNKEQAGNKALEEIGLLKQQLTLFAEDFEKERQDRAAAESKAEKMRKERDRLKVSLENKIKQLNSQFKGLEETIRSKSRQLADMQIQNDDLKLQLQIAQRRATVAPQHPYSSHPLPPSYNGPTTHLFQVSGGDRYNSEMTQITRMTVPQQVPKPITTGPGPPLVPAEHLAGAWTCRECTYINYPNRTVCDICGCRNLGDGESINFETGGQELHSRGDRASFDAGDIETDGQPADTN